jgi:hypothetical protein
VLVAVAPIVGTPRIVSPAGNTTRALGFEIAVVETELDAEAAAEPGAEGRSSPPIDSPNPVQRGEAAEKRLQGGRPGTRPRRSVIRAGGVYRLVTVGTCDGRRRLGFPA